MDEKEKREKEELKKQLHDMSLSQKLEYFWMYYKWVVVIGVFALGDGDMWCVGESYQFGVELFLGLGQTVGEFFLAGFQLGGEGFLGVGLVLTALLVEQSYLFGDGVAFGLGVVAFFLELTAGVVEVENLVHTLFHILYVLDFEAFDGLLFVIT